MEKSWSKNHGGRVMEEESWRRSHGGGVMDEESWKRNHRGFMEEESWWRNHGEGIHRRFSPLAQDNCIIMLCDIFNDIFWPNGFHVQTTEHDTLMIRKYEKDIIYIR